MRHVIVIALLALGCGTPPPTTTGMPDAGTPIVEAPAAPTAPEAPRSPCPTGWRTATEGDVTLCEPWTSDGAPTCAELEVARVGEGCAPAEACPTGTWPDDVPSAAVYVLEGGTGDGSRDQPFGTIAAGLAAAGGTGTVVVGAGTYREFLTLTGSPTIRGVCPERVHVIDPAATQQAPIVVRTGASPTLRGLHLEGTNHALWLLASSVANVSGVVMQAPQPILIEASAMLTADALRVSASSGTRSAIVVFPAGELTLTHAHVEGGDIALATEHARGTTGAGDATLRVSDTVILDTGAAFQGGWSGALERVAIERTMLGGVVLPDHELTMTDVRARDIRGDVGFLGVTGTAHLRRVAITDVENASTPAAVIAMSDLGTPAALDGGDLVIMHAANIGLATASIGAVTLDHVVMLDVTGGVQLRGDATVTLDDLRVVSRASADATRPAHAIELDHGRLVLTRANLAPSVTAAGVLVQTPGIAELHDVTTTGGVGLVAQCRESTCDSTRTTLVVSRTRIASASRFGVFLLAVGASVSDLDIAHVAFVPGPIPAFGVVAAGSRLAGARVHVDAVEGAAIASLEAGAIDLRSVSVEHASAVVLTGDVEEHWGDGLVCGSDGTMAIDGFDVSGSARAGLVASFACGPSVWRGTISGGAIGILTDEAPSPDLDFSGITLHDNGTAIASLTLEVPVLDPAF